MIKHLLILIGVSVLMQLTGCATIVDGKTQQVSITSVPEGAEVLVNGATIGKTPMTYALQRGEGTVLTVKKEGYATIDRTLNTELNSMFWGNIIFGGVFGSTTDSSTGASIEYSPGQFVFNLDKKS